MVFDQVEHNRLQKERYVSVIAVHPVLAEGFDARADPALAFEC
jgi:hypothetical protein